MNVHGPVLDDTGYAAQQRDYQFVSVTVVDIVDMLQRNRPLGFPNISRWDQCQRELADALHACGIANADVRLQGTSGKFFSSNPEKRFPQAVQELMQLAQRGGGTLAEVLGAWHQSPYATSTDLPGMFFWDARYTLKLDTTASDYDFQLSSDILAAAVHGAYPSGLDRRGRPIISDHGGHFRSDLVLDLYFDLQDWVSRWSIMLNRPFNIASFPAAGPVGIARFQSDDWRIIP